MKKIAICAASALLFAAAPAYAADMAPAYKAPSMVVVHNWTGCYLGVQAGVIWGKSKQTYGGERAGVPDPFLPVGYDVTGNYNVNGPLGGGEVGCNYQTGNWVFGIEADGAWANAHGWANPTAGAVAAGSNPARVFRTEQNWLATARARLGVAADKWLFFATGGIAGAGLEVNNDACAVATNACRTPTKVNRSGWIVGGGVEYALGGGWSAKGELLYADFGKFHYSDSPAANNCIQCYSMDVKLTELILRVALNYQFNWPK